MTFYLLLTLLPIMLIFVVILLAKFAKQKNKSRRDEQELFRSLYQARFFRQLHKSISYPFQAKKVFEAITGSTGQYLNCSAVSYAFLDEDKIRLKTFLKEKVEDEFLGKIRKAIMHAIYSIDGKNKSLPVLEKVADLLSPVGNFPDGEKTEYIATFLNNFDPTKINHGIMSYFNVPFVIDNKFVGILNVASVKPRAFSEKDMDMVYGNVRQAEKLIEKIDSLVSTEHGRIDSVLDHSPSGVVFLTVREGAFEVSYINMAAKEFLNIESKQPSVIKLFSSCLPSLDLLVKVKQIIKEKETLILEGIKILDREFKIFLSPTFLSKSQKLVGVAITLQNTTKEVRERQSHEDFTNMMIHELRAPLVSMKGASDLLLKSKISLNDKKKMLKLINESSERMLHDIGNLLDSAKIEAGKFSVTKVKTDLNGLVKERIEAFSYVAKENQISLTSELDGNIDPFDFDKSRIEEVFNNLISNSLKFTDPRGWIKLKTAREGNFVKVEVIDSGRGMPKERQESLFSKYGKSVSAGGKGTGLGLFISKNIIEAHGGKIWVDSKENVGTSIYFTIPVVSETKAEPNPKTALPSYSSISQKVMN